ncbi:hypothetical protein C8Q73DRAFT_675845 [Cubamyces lactineus]|nr:hypothetical protein C8Q73DRAFT_675845 [Cubamyces lactineus]
MNPRDIRARLPSDLLSWRIPGPDLIDDVTLWENARKIFEDVNIYLWQWTDPCYQRAREGDMVLSSGFAYIRKQRVESWGSITKRFNNLNGSCHGATMADGHSAVARIIAIGDGGQNHLNALRKLACGADSLLVDNHTIPLWREVHFEDMVFGVFPFIGETLENCYAPWIKNSVGDIIDMILQALQGLAFVHSRNIAHRDADKANFLVQWHPESLDTMQVPIVRPRVYLNDFERAWELPTCIFSNDMDPLSHIYSRPTAPEVQSGEPYDAFKTDVWQFSASFWDFRSTVPAIDEVLEAMRGDNAATRPSSSEARDRLAVAFHSTAPIHLLIPPEVHEELLVCDHVECDRFPGGIAQRANAWSSRLRGVSDL